MMKMLVAHKYWLDGNNREEESVSYDKLRWRVLKIGFLVSGTVRTEDRGRSPHMITDHFEN